jgi:hypothetical protein
VNRGDEAAGDKTEKDAGREVVLSKAISEFEIFVEHGG